MAEEVYAGFISNVNIPGNIYFINNSAYHGGGVYAYSNINISGKTNFINNSARSGGGVYANSASISGEISFVENTAIMEGGGVCLCTISRLLGGHKRSLDINGNTVFISNSARGGGGIYAMGMNSNVNISGNITFIFNSASRDGGGVSVAANTCLDVSGNTTFIGNLAKRYGRAINAGSIVLQKSVEIPLLVVTRLVIMVEESLHGLIVVC